MSGIARRFISTNVMGKIYSSQNARVVKNYLEKAAMKHWEEEAKRAESIEIVGAGHKGGTVRTEPFHLNVHVRDKEGEFIKTQNPHTERFTNIWHVYIASSKKDLYDKATEWFKKHDGK